MKTFNEFQLFCEESMKKAVVTQWSLLDAIVGLLDSTASCSRKVKLIIEHRRLTWKPYTRLTQWLLGITGEVGELCNKIKHLVFSYAKPPPSREEMISEFGDVLHYLANLATECGISMSEVVDNNVDKISTRRGLK